MKTRSAKTMLLLALLLFSGVGFLFAHGTGEETKSQLSFTENKGQWEQNILFQADFRGGRLFLEKNNLMYVFYHPEDMASMHPKDGKVTDRVRLHAVKVEMTGGNASAVEGNEEFSYHKNYFIGSDASRWASDVKHYGEVFYRNIYPNTDLKIYSKSNELKYDYVLQPNGNVADIKLKYSGAGKMSVKYGMLYMELSVGTIIEGRPYAYQQINGETIEVECKYVLRGSEVGFKVKNYNKNFPLVIDPTLIFSSYSGSFADNWGTTATYDAAGNLLTGGLVNGAGYPVTIGAYQSTFAGGGPGGNGFTCDIGIMKFNTTGTALLYSTYLGGSDNEIAQSIFVDASDNMIVYGRTYSANFPVTAGAYDVTFNGNADIVIFKLNSTGTALLASTFLGGTGNDGVNISAAFATMTSIKYNYGDDARGEIIADAGNNYFIGANTQSFNFPVTAGAYQTAFGGGTQDGCVFKFNTTLSTLIWSTYLGGNNNDACYGLKLDGTGDIYVTGGTASANFPATAGTIHPAFQGGIADGFITHLASSGSSILQSTFIGTTSYDQTYFLEIDTDGDIYVTGQTMGNYPVSAGVYFNAGGKQFVHKMNPSLSTTYFSTVYGTNSASPNISPTAFLVDICENIYMSGWGRCASLGNPNPNSTLGMPVTANAFQSVNNVGQFPGCDFYFIVIEHDALSIIYGTFFGGSLSSEHVDGGTSRFDPNGTIYQSVCAGCFANSDFPTTPGAWSNTNNSSLCNNGVIKLDFDVLLSVSSFTASPLSGCAPFIANFINQSTGANTYLWDFGDGSPQDTATQPSHIYPNPGVYIVMLIAMNTGSCNLSDTAYATVTVTPPAPINPVIQFNSSGSCDSLLVSFTAQFSAGQIINWDFGDNTSDTGVSVSHLYVGVGTYIVTLIINDTICINADTATVTIIVSPALPFTVNIQYTDTLFCNSLSVLFTATSVSNATYFWDFGDMTSDTTNPAQHTYTISGNYTVIVIVTDTICNATGSDTIVINVPPFGIINTAIFYNPTVNCDSLVAAFGIITNFGHTFVWDFGDASTGNGTNVSHTYTVQGTYIVMLVVTDTICNLTDTSYQTVNFYPPVTATLTLDSIYNFCLPLTVNLQGSSTSTGSTYQWTIDSLQVSVNNTLTHTFDSAGTYNISLIVSTAASCNLADTFNYSFTAYDNPIAAFTYDMHPVNFADEIIQFYDQSIGASQWYWTFSDDTFSVLQNPQYAYAYAGIYPVCLWVANVVGCPDDVCHDVPITETIYVPNVFTPNGDHKNELFRVYSSGLFDMNVKIFNRWGELLHEWQGLDGSWDGFYKGRMVQQDVYVYYIVARGFWETNIVRIGRVTVIK